LKLPRVPLDGVDPVRLRAALEKATAALLAERNERGFWEGELSSSALSTATAVTALALAVKHGAIPKAESGERKAETERGLAWLAANQNADGGWGDTTKSLSNISTTTLCWAAFGACEADESFREAVRRAEAWLIKTAGNIEPHQLARTIVARYGKDRTFSVPILTMCALAGRLGAGRGAWRDVIPLPFELAALPHGLFAALRLPVVSYALPALIAIGQARHFHAPSRNPFARLTRALTRDKTLRVLAEIQPGNGGFLEATPLTSFVTMSLVASGEANHVVAQRGLKFLVESQRADGSWPIDTNLSTWCTTLAIDALPASQLSTLSSQPLGWLLAQQYCSEHPYTHAAPGGWAWTDLPGGVPDADDTSGALIALAKMRSAECGARNNEIVRAAEMGIRWLLDLQNRDGGIPTFCRGWGALPFDRSSADITAHAIRAWLAWLPEFSREPRLAEGIGLAIAKGTRFLEKQQRPDGSWLPLWFGHQNGSDDENPVYGTARVVTALAEVIEWCRTHGGHKEVLPLMRSGAAWLCNNQHTDGGWSVGPTSSTEETALAVSSLCAAAHSNAGIDCSTAIQRGCDWLMQRIESGEWREPSPIGFYFAKLWYFEKLYPFIFTVGALRTASELSAQENL
jgi:squalene-hopene/tetraprenyl-beta-curcumene cyclase